MEFYEVLERRRTIRDFSDKIVTDEVLEKILSAAFKAPTNDHLRQFEFNCRAREGEHRTARSAGNGKYPKYPASRVGGGRSDG